MGDLSILESAGFAPAFCSAFAPETPRLTDLVCEELGGWEGLKAGVAVHVTVRAAAPATVGLGKPFLEEGAFIGEELGNDILAETF